VPFTHSLETVGVQNTDTMGLSSLNMWEKVAWLKPIDSYSRVIIDRLIVILTIFILSHRQIS
jgi:hypothetical protein